MISLKAGKKAVYVATEIFVQTLVYPDYLRPSLIKDEDPNI